MGQRNIYSLLTRFFPMIAIALISLGTGHIGFAESEPHITLGQACHNMTLSMGDLARFITSLSYVMGFGFGVGSILKFKAHKDNPSQIPIGTPISMVFLACALVFLPMIFVMAEYTIFGGHAMVGGAHGVASF